MISADTAVSTAFRDLGNEVWTHGSKRHALMGRSLDLMSERYFQEKGMTDFYMEQKAIVEAEAKQASKAPNASRLI